MGERAQKKYKRSAEEISNTIDKTGLNEGNIKKFLFQLNKIRDCVMKQPESLHRMNQKLSTFITLMEREFDTELSIESYFEFQNLGKYGKALKKIGYDSLEDLECKDQDQFNDDILSICQNVDGFNNRDLRTLKQICLKPDISWKRYQNEKNKVVTEQMAETAPILKKCFGSMDDAMKSIQIETKKALELNPKNKKQSNSIDLLHKTAEKSLCLIQNFKEKECKESKGEKVIKLKALTVATGISDCCSEIIRNQRDVADSVLLTKSILDSKPNKFKKKNGSNKSLEIRVKERVKTLMQNAWRPHIKRKKKKTKKNNIT